MFKKKRPPKHAKQMDVEVIRKPINFGIYFIILVVVTVIAVALISWDNFTIRDIEINGAENIKYLDIIHLSGIEYMSNIFAVNLNDIKKNIEQNPILAVDNIKRILPSTIEITLTERKAVAVIAFSDGHIIINSECIAIGVLDSSQTPNKPIILGTEVIEYELGNKINLKSNIHIEKITDILIAVESTNIGDLIKTIDISLTENIKLKANAGYEVQVGSTTNIINKCNWIKTMIPKLEDQGKQGGTLYITNVNSAHYTEPDAD